MKTPSKRYNESEFDAQFDDCLGRDEYDGERVGVATIFWLARQFGWTGGTPQWVSNLNEKFAWIERFTAIYRLEFSDFAKPTDFRQQFANQFTELPGRDGLKRVPVGDAWLKHPARRQHRDLVMRPGSSAVTSDNRLNTWQGFAVEPAAGDVVPFFELFDRLISDPNARRYVLLWLVHLLQRPHIKMSTALVIWSRIQGVGKNLLFECFSRIIGERHATVIGQADVDRDFNSWARDKILVIGDEVIGQDRRQHADRLKAQITGTTIQINEKHQPVVELPNLVNFILFSNHPNAVFIGDDDRRYFVWEVEAEPLSPAQAKAFVSWRDNGGLNALLYEFQSFDLADFDPKAHAPSTAAKRLMIEANRSDVEVWADQIVSSGARQILGRELATAQELAARYEQETGRPKPSTRTITLTFKRLGAIQRDHQVRVGPLKLRPLAIDRPGHWRAEPESSWAIEMAKPLSLSHFVPQPCLTIIDSEDADPVRFSQKDAA